MYSLIRGHKDVIPILLRVRQHIRTLNFLRFINIDPINKLNQLIIQLFNTISHINLLLTNLLLPQLSQSTLLISNIVNKLQTFNINLRSSNFISRYPRHLIILVTLPSLHIRNYNLPNRRILHRQLVTRKKRPELSIRSNLEQINRIKKIYPLQLRKNNLTLLRLVVHPNQQRTSIHRLLRNQLLQVVLDDFTYHALSNNFKRCVRQKQHLVHIETAHGCSETTRNRFNFKNSSVGGFFQQNLSLFFPPGSNDKVIELKNTINFLIAQVVNHPERPSPVNFESLQFLNHSLDKSLPTDGLIYLKLNIVIRNVIVNDLVDQLFPRLAFLQTNRLVQKSRQTKQLGEFLRTLVFNQRIQLLSFCYLFLLANLTEKKLPLTHNLSRNKVNIIPECKSMLKRRNKIIWLVYFAQYHQPLTVGMSYFKDSQQIFNLIIFHPSIVHPHSHTAIKKKDHNGLFLLLKVRINHTLDRIVNHLRNHRRNSQSALIINQ